MTELRNLLQLSQGMPKISLVKDFETEREKYDEGQKINILCQEGHIFETTSKKISFWSAAAGAGLCPTSSPSQPTSCCASVFPFSPKLFPEETYATDCNSTELVSTLFAKNLALLTLGCAKENGLIGLGRCKIKCLVEHSWRTQDLALGNYAQCRNSRWQYMHSNGSELPFESLGDLCVPKDTETCDGSQEINGGFEIPFRSTIGQVLQLCSQGYYLSDFGFCKL